MATERMGKAIRSELTVSRTLGLKCQPGSKQTQMLLNEQSESDQMTSSPVVTSKHPYCANGPGFYMNQRSLDCVRVKSDMADEIKHLT